MKCERFGIVNFLGLKISWDEVVYIISGLVVLFVKRTFCWIVN